MNEMLWKKFMTKSKDETKGLAQNFAKKLSGGDIVLLSGDLGAGKTVFAKGLAKGLGIDEDITSPTFTIMNCYQNKLNHFDLYRLNSVDELLGVGAEEELYSDKISLVEWPEIVGFDFFPNSAIVVQIVKVDENTREINFKLND